MDQLSSERTAETRVEMVMQAIRKRIRARQATNGVRLPSIRALTQHLNVSKSTVVDAYERLVAEGEVASRPGSGFYIAGHMPPLSIMEDGPELSRDVDPVWMTRQSLAADSDLMKPGCGWLPPSWMPEPEIQRALRAHARQGQANLVDYSTPQGLPALRQRLSRKLMDRSIEATPDQIILTESGTHSVDLLCRFFLKPDDVVILDDPCYFNFHALLRAHRVQVVGVPFTPNGPDLKAFEQALIEHKPRLYITNSGLQNPTGATLSPVNAHRVLKLAEQHDLTIIEDDIFADLEHGAAPRLAAFDGFDRVVQIGSFSKTLSASIRCGYIAAKNDWVAEITNLKLATSFGAGAFSQQVVLHLLKDGAYRRHVNSLREKLALSISKAIPKLENLGLSIWTKPNAGMFLWCELPNQLDAVQVARFALEENMMLAPGNAFSANQTANSHLRFNVAQMSDPEIYRILEKAMKRADRIE